MAVSKKEKDKKRDKKKHRPEPLKGEAAELQRTPALDLRRVELPPRPKPMKPADIRALRTSLNASQVLFARLLNVSPNAVESWEQGVRAPRQATLKLLHIVRKRPESLLD